VGLGLLLLAGGFRNRRAEAELTQDEAARLTRLSDDEQA